MKRKDVEHIADFSFSPLSRKSRRLVATSIPVINEGGLLQEQEPSNNSTMQPDAAVTTGLMPFDKSSEERAIMLYNPANTPIPKSPSTTDFTFIVNSDWIPGLKNYLFGLEGSNSGRNEEILLEESTGVSNDSLAVVPWVPSHFPLTTREEEGMALPEEMEAEEVEMMDTDEPNFGDARGNDSEFKGMMDGAVSSQHWQPQQQHCNFYQPAVSLEQLPSSHLVTNPTSYGFT